MSSNEYISINRLASSVAQKFKDSLYVFVYFDTFYNSSFNRVNIKPLKIAYVNKYLEFKPIDDLFPDIRYVSAPDFMVKNIKSDMFAKLIIDVKEQKNNHAEPFTYHVAHIYAIFNEELHWKLNPSKKEINKEIVSLDIDPDMF